jgi:hypothetical protein
MMNSPIKCHRRGTATSYINSCWSAGCGSNGDKLDDPQCDDVMTSLMFVSVHNPPNHHNIQTTAIRTPMEGSPNFHLLVPKAYLPIDLRPTLNAKVRV